jgi:hypothetical protein
MKAWVAIIAIVICVYLFFPFHHEIVGPDDPTIEQDLMKESSPETEQPVNVSDEVYSDSVSRSVYSN